jgi:hypothetical protein
MIVSPEIIIIAILFFTTFVSVAWAVKVKLQSTKLTATIAQLLLDKQAIADELDRVSFISSNSTDIENGFIKFLSETRESAYVYIEDVQSTIVELQGAMESGSDTEITIAYQKLINLLPASSTGMID